MKIKKEIVDVIFSEKSLIKYKRKKATNKSEAA